MSITIPMHQLLEDVREQTSKCSALTVSAQLHKIAPCLKMLHCSTDSCLTYKALIPFTLATEYKSQHV
eukprot:m.323756 g.323756  ORF g.323756 m.323756 type:complete len:68 (-) comp16539_c0_seq5:73-276(-)